MSHSELGASPRPKKAIRKRFAYDVFLSHNAKDKPTVRELAKQLKQDGLRVWFDEWVIQPGDSIPLKIEQGLEQSRTLILIMSQNAFASEWVTLERHTALFRDPTNAERRFIPLRLDNAEITDTLKQFAYIDWRQKAPDQYARLLTACRPASAENRPTRKRQRRSHAIRVLKGHTNAIHCMAILPDGQRAVSASRDQTVRVWDLATGQCLTTLEGHTEQVYRVVNLPDGQRAVSVSRDRTVRVWDLATGQCLATLEGHTGTIFGVAVTADGQRAVSASGDETVRVWDLATGQCLTVLEGHTSHVYGVAVTADGQRAVSGSFDRTVRMWDLATGQCLTVLEGHTGPVWDVAVTADGQRAVSGSEDRTVRVWDLATGQCLATLEGHTGTIFGVAVTADGQRAVSGSEDQTVRVWNLPPITGEAREAGGATRYTNAKVLLVGDSGVGKSGLAYRLTEDRFVTTISTDAAWATQLPLPHNAGGDDIEREIWLWDFAGQADYRLVHQLYMDETALAILVFNPQSENPFEGLGQWDHDLMRAARRPFKKLLVAGRCDRGGLMVSRESIERFRGERGFAAYLETSAYTGAGCQELRETIVHSISWTDIAWTSSPGIFKVLKDAIVKLKDEGKVLLRIAELKQQLDMRLPREQFSLDELRAVVGLLAGPGVVWQLDFGDFVLLQPERINAYAAAVIRSVRAHTDEIGCISEERVLAGALDYQDMQRLPPAEEEIILRAMHQTFVDYGLCLRERTDEGTLLVFPSYFRRERPELEDYPAVLVSYQFSGALDEIYATLVVRLHHTTPFDTDQLWRFAADFKTPSGKRVGLKMAKRGEGAAELVVYFEPGVPDDVKVTFIRYVHEHIQRKATDVTRLRYYVCPHCHAPVENRKTALERLNRGLKDIVCVNCEQRVLLWDLIEEKFASPEFQQRVRALEEQATARIDNESRELILVGHAFAISGEAGQIFRPTPNSDWGIDGEIEFKDDDGKASGKRLYLQLKSGDSYLFPRQRDDAEIFTIKNQRHVKYWQQQAYPVMLVLRTSDGTIRWMNVTEYLQKQGRKQVKQIVFKGEPFTAQALQRLRDRMLQTSATLR